MVRIISDSYYCITNHIIDKEVKKFKETTVEATSLIRALFFMLVGFLMQAKEILNLVTIPLAASIVLLIIVVRLVVIKISKLEASPVLFIAPRGLITILPFLSIPSEQNIPNLNEFLNYPFNYFNKAMTDEKNKDK